MTQQQVVDSDGTCRHCGSALRANAPFCGSCGQAVPNRGHQHPALVARPVQNVAVAAMPQTADRIVGAGRGVRCASFMMDLAVMLSPALPLAVAGAILGVAEVVYIVVPIAFAAVWVWMQIWQGYTGLTFGSSMLGLRLVRSSDHRPPGLAACVTRGGVFAATLGVVALPVVINESPHDGLHDKVAGLTMIDVVLGANPVGKKQDPVFRRSLDRGLNKVSAPLPVNMSGRP